MDLYSAIFSLSESIEEKDIIDNEAVEEILTMINEGGKDLIRAVDFDFDDDDTLSLFIETIKLKVPVEIIIKMIEVGGKELLMKTDACNPTALHIAFESDAVLDLIPKLIEVGGRDLVKIGEEYGKSALHYACEINPSKNHNEAMAKLIEFGGKELVMTKDYSGDTVLHYATYNSMSLEIIKMMIDVGGRDLLKEENDDNMMAVYMVFSESELDEDEIFEILVLLIKEGIYHNVNDEFSIGGLLERYQEGDIFGDLWHTRLLPVLKEVYRLIQHESPNKTPPLLHSMIMIKAPKFVILDILHNFDGIASIKDTSGQYAIDVAIKMKCPFDRGMEEILEVTAMTNGWDFLHCATQRGLPWNNWMQKLVLRNLDDATNGVNKETGLKLFMTAAIGGDLDTIYSLTRMDPMCIFL